MEALLQGDKERVGFAGPGPGREGILKEWDLVRRRVRCVRRESLGLVGKGGAARALRRSCDYPPTGYEKSRVDESPREVDGGEDDDEDGDGEEGERDQAPFRPLDLRPAHALNELLALPFRLRELPLLWSAERREEDECTGDPEQREH